MPNEQRTPCPVCGGQDFTLLFEDLGQSGRSLYRCANCGVQRLEPLPTAEEIKAIYGANYFRSWGMEEGENPQIALMKKRTFAKRLKELSRFVAPGRIMDVGTASGFLLEVAQAQGYDPWGVEVSEYAATLAKRKFGEQRIWNGTLETAPFPRNCFSAITMCDLIEHVPDPVGTLQTAAEFLVPGGVVLIMTPNAASLSNRLMGKRWTHYKAEHLFYFHRRSITHLSRRSGLDLISFAPAVKSLTLRYVHTQLQSYPHRILTPAANALYTTAFFARDWQIPMTIGEFTAILRKPAAPA